MSLNHLLKHKNENLNLKKNILNYGKETTIFYQD